jgi:hypothetical protein
MSSLPQYAFMAWCSVKAEGQLYLLSFQYSLGEAEKSTKTVDMIAGNPVGIRIGYLPNTRLECYRYSDVLYQK